MAIQLCGFLASKNFHPMNGALTLVGFLNGFIHDSNHDRCDVNASAISFDKWNDWIQRHIQGLISIDRDFFAL